MLTEDGRRLPTKGPLVCRWITNNVRLGPGDYYGRPFRLTTFEKRWVHRLLEYYPETAEFRYKRALFGTAKGNGKTPFEGALGAAGMCGPLAPISPLVLVAASSLAQSNLVFGDLSAGIMHDSSPLKPYLDAFDLSIQFSDGSSGEIKRVAAALGSNDGPRATLLLADELHEWLGKLAGVFDVLDGAIGKRRNAQTVGISTSGTDPNSLLGRMYARGKALASGEIVDDATLFEWYEIPETVEIPERIKTEADLAQWRHAISFANPALTDGKFLHESYIRSRFDGAQQIERYKWLRYHGNRWTAARKHWLPPGKWADDRRPGSIAPGANCVLAFCGTYNRDSAALILVDIENQFLSCLDVWEPSPGSKNYEVPHQAVRAQVREAMAKYRMQRFVVVPNGWHGEASDWASDYGPRVVVEFDWMHQNKRKHDACSKFFTSVVTGEIGHDGDPALARHLASATPRETSEGSWIAKDGRDGPPIDGAIAAVVAWDQASALGKRRRSGRAVFV